jgi:Lon protease-like protein
MLRARQWGLGRVERRMELGRFVRATVFVGLLAACSTAWAQSGTAGNAPGANRLPAVIPLFPLEDAMLFPNAARPFLIFEPRYRAMVADALKGDRVIGMATLKPGFEADYEGRPPIFAIGCAGMITDYEELPDGRFTIVLRGMVKFRVTGEDHSRPYRLAHVSSVPESKVDEAALRSLRQRLEALAANRGARLSPDLRDEEAVDTLAQYLEVEPPRRQALLELQSPLERSKALLDLLGSVVARLRCITPGLCRA